MASLAENVDSGTDDYGSIRYHRGWNRQSAVVLEGSELLQICRRLAAEAIVVRDLPSPKIHRIIAHVVWILQQCGRENHHEQNGAAVERGTPSGESNASDWR